MPTPLTKSQFLYSHPICSVSRRTLTNTVCWLNLVVRMKQSGKYFRCNTELSKKKKCVDLVGFSLCKNGRIKLEWGKARNNYVGMDGNWRYCANSGFLKYVCTCACAHVCIFVCVRVCISVYTFFYYLALSAERTKKQRCPSSSSNEYTQCPDFHHKMKPVRLRKMDDFKVRAG